MTYPLSAGQFATHIWKRFDAKTAIETLYNATHMDAPCERIIQEALGIWVVTPRSLRLIKSAVLRKTFEIIVAFGDGYRKDLSLIDADITTLQALDQKFIDETYKAVGGMEGLFNAECNDCFERKLKEQFKELEVHMFMVELAHMQLDATECVPQVVTLQKACQIASKYYIAKNTRRSKANPKAPKRGPGAKRSRWIEEEWPRRSSSIALAYAASTVKTQKSNLLMDLYHSKTLSSSDIRLWLERSRFVAESVLPWLMKTDLSIKATKPLESVPSRRFDRQARTDESALVGLLQSRRKPRRR